MLEIEKTFLVKAIPQNLSQYKSYKIKQGYISPTPGPLRIRQKGDNYELTKKNPVKEGDHSTYEEMNINITEYEFNKLWTLVNKSLEKTRYIIPLNNDLTAELDIFEGALNGLSVVEVEFKSQDDMNSFNPPGWFGQDVTQEEFSSNFFLAGKNFSEIRQYF